MFDYKRQKEGNLGNFFAGNKSSLSFKPTLSVRGPGRPVGSYKGMTYKKK